MLFTYISIAYGLLTAPLKEELEVLPGSGTVIAVLPKSSSAERTQLLGTEIEQLVVEAKKLRMELNDVLAAVSKHWQRLGGAGENPSGYQINR
jgi:GntR family transcriptional regulator